MMPAIRFTFLLILFTSALALAPAQSFRETQPSPARLTPEEFPIIAWGQTLGDAQALADMKDCGFNVAGFVAPKDVKQVKKAGLKCFVEDQSLSTAINDAPITDEEIARRVAAVTKKFKNNETVFGYYLKDEPVASWFPNLGRWRAALAQADPHALAYINLLPVGAQGPGVADYDEYLRTYIDKVQPKFVSYDHYTLVDDGSVRDSLYVNLEKVRAITQERGLPFWNIILSNSHYHYATPTPAGLRLQAYATLAYGGRGLSYFTYFTPIFADYREAPIDQFLHKTPTWEMVRNVNLQLHTLGPVYVKLKSLNVFHYPEAPAGCTGTLKDSRLLAELTSEGPVLVGEFTHEDGRPFVMIVNKDIHHGNKINARFKQPGTITYTNPFTGKTYPWGIDSATLAPGQGMLLGLQSEK